MKRIGVDVGGTFTDLIYVDDEAGVIRVHKLPTTPDDPSQGTIQGLKELAAAAVSIIVTTSPGWDTIATWFVGTSVVVAPIRAANCRSASGGIAWSPSATRNQDGSDFQAGVPITSSNAEACRGCCTACITLALLGSTSAAKWFTKSSSGSQAKPCSSMSRCAVAGVGGPCSCKAPIDSPSSSAKPAM